MKKKYLLISLVSLILIALTVYFINKGSFWKEEPVLPAVYKPNIYIYPEKAIDLTVKISFPKGGEIVKSIPKYSDGWSFKVDSLGKIDKKWNYLFYESIQPDEWQKKAGWLLKKDTLLTFFENNMNSYGFSTQEIKDFTDYWIPRLKKEKYLVFPQLKTEIDPLVKLHFSKDPKQILRLFYVIKECKEDILLKSPHIPQKFLRKGFFVTEWGVVLL